MNNQLKEIDVNDLTIDEMRGYINQIIKKYDASKAVKFVPFNNRNDQDKDVFQKLLQKWKITIPYQWLEWVLDFLYDKDVREYIKGKYKLWDVADAYANIRKYGIIQSQKTLHPFYKYVDLTSPVANITNETLARTYLSIKNMKWSYQEKKKRAIQKMVQNYIYAYIESPRFVNAIRWEQPTHWLQHIKTWLDEVLRIIEKKRNNNSWEDVNGTQLSLNFE